MFCIRLRVRRFVRSITLTLCTIIVCACTASAKTHYHKPSAMGKDYYIVFPKNAFGNQNTAVLINSPVNQTLTITPAGGGQPYAQALSVKPDSTHIHSTIANIFHIEDSSEVIDRRGAVHFQGTSYFNLIGQYGLTPSISSTYTALPVTSWGNEYWVIDEHEGANIGYFYYPEVYSVPNFTIIAAHDSTQVTIKLTTTSASGKEPGVPFVITLDQGDVYYVSDAADPRGINPTDNACTADFSGTHITSNYPIGVIVGQSWQSEPCGDNECGDAGQEWLPPVSNWDSDYVLSPAVPGEAEGEFMLVGIGHDSTRVAEYDPANGFTILGSGLTAGTVLRIARPIVKPILLLSTGPILPLEITRQSSLCAPTGGINGYAFAMIFPPGVHQWSDHTSFSTADGGVQNVLNVYYRDTDYSHIRLNGVPLNRLKGTVQNIGGGYSWFNDTVASGGYYELACDTGTVCGGSVFGSGASKGIAYKGGGGKQIMDPESPGSFAHPVGINGLPLYTNDSTIPSVTVTSDCAGWSIVARDSGSSATGIYDISLVENYMPDSSFNVQSVLMPVFEYGDQSVRFKIQALDVASPAQAVLHVRNGAGNELDTTLVFSPIIRTDPSLLDVGMVRGLHSVTGTIGIMNIDSVHSLVITNARLKINKQWKIIPSMLKLPDTLAPFMTDTVFLQYNAPNTLFFQTDYDTLLVTTCNESPVATMMGENDTTATAVQEEIHGAVSDIVLQQNFPNPFTGATTFTFTAPQTGAHLVRIYNSLGERIATLAAHETAVGHYSAEWNAGGWVSGVYYYEVASGNSSMRMRQMKEFVLIR